MAGNAGTNATPTKRIELAELLRELNVDAFNAIIDTK
eukprot:gene30983-44284_t